MGGCAFTRTRLTTIRGRSCLRARGVADMQANAWGSLIGGQSPTPIVDSTVARPCTPFSCRSIGNLLGRSEMVGLEARGL